MVGGICSKIVNVIKGKNKNSNIDVTATFLSRAKSDMDFRAIFPERVFGSDATQPTRRNAATGPTNSRTSWIASLLISSMDFTFAARHTKYYCCVQVSANTKR